MPQYHCNCQTPNNTNAPRPKDYFCSWCNTYSINQCCIIL